MISGASEEELIIANARAEVLTKCGKNVLDILDNQNEEYERKLENEVKYQNSEVIRLNNIINELEKSLEKVFEKMEEKQIEIEGRGYYYTDLLPIEEVLDKLKELKGGKNENKW